jgi:hypothetical protein
MTYIPTNQGSGNVTATIDSTVANFGAVNFPHSPNFGSGESSTETYEQDLNALNIGTTVP